MNDEYSRMTAPYLEAIFKPYGFEEPVRRRIFLDENTFKAFEKLPRDRESDAEIAAMFPIAAAGVLTGHITAKKQEFERAKLSKWLAERIAHELSGAICSRDTINGYEPNELR